MSRTFIDILLCLTLLPPLSASPHGTTAQEKTDPDVNARIRKEERENSQIMRTLHFLTDVYGPRLTGTPNLKAAEEWAVKQLRDWGLENARLEPWEFGSPGWTNDRLSAQMVAPIKAPLVCGVVAWTPSTNGTVAAQAYQISLPEKPTQEELNAYFESVKEKVKGKIVLAGRYRPVPVDFNPPERRLTDQEVRELLESKKPNPAKSSAANPQQAAQLTAQQVSLQVDHLLIANGALLRINNAGEAHGVIRAITNTVRDLSQHVPTVVMRNDDYGRISRLIADGSPVELEFNINNHTYPEGRTAYNAIAEVPGTDKRDEVVMIGAHLDSHHLATGATDNAVNCAVMMEAVRILKAVGVRPRRTIRIGLWSGEEQRALGSQVYVKEHFGTFENPKPAFAKLDAYINLDEGTGRIRAVRVFGPAEVADVLRQILAPFKDLGVLGTGTYSNRTYGGSDHSSFSMNGLPAFYIDQDPIEYGEFTWHTNLDTYDRVIEEDVKQNAIVIGATVYQLAMRDELLPRFSREQMPPPGSLGIIPPNPSNAISTRKKKS